ncbi:unnamed protein product [Lymnaea stagnalis]|uniref:RWD domain-containing protein n=1 Tax=Lymnaea stagnalis TaxID=6523 RepID=A0AAV2HP28_LYMST
MTQENLPKSSASSSTGNSKSHSHSLLSEIENLSQTYPNTKKLPTNSPDGSLTVLVQPFYEKNLFLRFQLTAQYPELQPAISISSDCLTKTATNDLIRLLETKASALKGQPMLLTLVSEGYRLMKSEETQTKTEVNKNKKYKRHKNVRDAEIGQKSFNGENKPSDIDINEKSYIGVLGDKRGESSYQQEKSGNKKPARPTHFIAVRITNEAIVKNLEQVQKQLVYKEPLLAKGVFQKETFHLTLCTLGLDTPEQIQHCIASLEQFEPDLKSSVPQTPLMVYSMSQFYNRAIYAKIKETEDLTKFQKLLREKMIAFGVEIRDEHEGFTPHVTIIKVKRPERKLFGSRNIQPSIYSHVIHTTFGEQPVESLFLCTMDGQRRSDGFYVTHYEISFQST